MSLFIGIDTGTSICSVALFDHKTLISIQEEEGRIHSEKTAVFIENCLIEAGASPSDIRAVGVGIGPGSYTGLRVGLSVAKGFCFAAGVDLIAIDSLEILASGSIQLIGKEQADHRPMIDARRMEVYTALYSESGVIKQGMEAAILEGDFLDRERTIDSDVYLSGDGAEKAMSLPGRPKSWKDSGIRSSARHMGMLIESRWQAGDRASIAYTNPKYLKKPNITTSRKTLL